ncbi:ubiquinol-cytochrome C reductase hinge protein-domain-containing protein [Xylaria intraflava]|nr:ubiquinol-cytochrome C reductase hinge protein-domain-containing protein [Xylaria intraflava]
MGVWDVINDLVEAATPWSTAEAEAPAQEKATEVREEGSDETKSDQATGGEQAVTEEAEKEEEEAEEEAEEEEEEEEEEELVDPKDKLEEECRNSKQCAPAKHHFDECVERVTNASNDDGAEKEDCVEEFFHLAHCATQCAAPKLWSILK